MCFEVVDASRWPVGWAMVGRPVAPALQARGYFEVTRVATNGARNACSMLYGAAARWARERGPIVTYTLAIESGSSLRGAGWVTVDLQGAQLVRGPGRVKGRGDGWANRPGRQPSDGLDKVRWAPTWALAEGA